MTWCVALGAATACTQAPKAASQKSQAGAEVAQINSGTDILRMMHDRYATKWYSTVSFTQATEMRLPNDSIAHQTWYETAKLPGYLRINRGANDAKNVIIFRGDSVYSRSNGGRFQGRKHRNDLLVLGFDVYAQPVERTVSILKDEGYDLSKVGEAVWQGRPVWVVGAATGDSTSRQFWIDKDRLLFVRSLGPGLRDRTRTAEVIFGQYEPLAGGWIAREVTAIEGGKTIQRESYTNIQANVTVPDDYFDPARIR
jgi:hypothetical protein